jgi:hypothetical protein
VSDAAGPINEGNELQTQSVGEIAETTSLQPDSIQAEAPPQNTKRAPRSRKKSVPPQAENAPPETILSARPETTEAAPTLKRKRVSTRKKPVEIPAAGEEVSAPTEQEKPLKKAVRPRRKKAETPEN